MEWTERSVVRLAEDPSPWREHHSVAEDGCTLVVLEYGARVRAEGPALALRVYGPGWPDEKDAPPPGRFPTLEELHQALDAHCAEGSFWAFPAIRCNGPFVDYMAGRVYMEIPLVQLSPGKGPEGAVVLGSIAGAQLRPRGQS